MHKYEDIINLKYIKSKKYNHMSLMDRCSQFAPFAALTGYSEIINETSRITEDKKDIDDGLKNLISSKLIEILDIIDSKPKIKVIYFKKDLRKNGGKYIDYIGNIRRIDNINNYLIFVDKTKIKIEDILEVNII